MAVNVWQTGAEALMFLLYTFVLFIIIKSKTRIFKNAFYSIFVATGVADIASLSTSCFIRLNHELCLGEAFQDVVMICLIVCGAAFIAHMTGNIIITFNRYSALCYMKKYDVIWRRKNVWAVIVVQYIVSFAAFLHLIGAKLVYTYNDDGKSVIKGLEKDADLIARFTYFGTCIVCGIVNLAINVKLLVEWHRLSKTDGSLKQRYHEKKLKTAVQSWIPMSIFAYLQRLLIYTACVFVCSLLMCTQQFTKAIATFTNNDPLNSWATQQYFWINDVMVSIPPLSLLLLSSDLRHDIVNFFQREKNRNGVDVNVTISARNTRNFAVEKF